MKRAIMNEQNNQHAHLDSVQLWTRFVEEKVIDTDFVQQEIARSWHRCASSGVEPLSPIIPASKPVVDRGDFLEQNENGKLLDIARSHMKQLYSSVEQNGHYIVILTVLDAMALEVLGHRKMLATGEQRGVTALASCAERYLGNTSASICMEERHPFRVMTTEHFVRDMHDWCCSGAPIFDDCGKVVAVLNVANDNHQAHYPYILDLTTATARAIEAEIRFRKINHMYYKTYHYLTSVLESMPEPLMLIDHTGKIEYLNSRTASVLGKMHKDCVGKNVFKDFAGGHRHADRCLEGTELTWKTGAGTTVELSLLAKTLSGLNGNSSYVGMIKRRGSSGSGDNKAVYSFEDIKCGSDLMEKVIFLARRAAMTDLGILVSGESGTGKELFAQSIHNYSHRSEKPFVAVNCAALPKDLIQSELFGFEEGMFTGAKRGGNPGKFELAQGGTIFLDEIGDMPLEMQANLLRVLQEKAVMRIGGRKPIPLDVRIIAATNKDIYNEIKAGRFRADLYYRLSVMTIDIPPLRDRKEDVELLFGFFIEKHRTEMGIFNDIQITDDALEMLMEYEWPGNVRELEHVAIVVLNNLHMDCDTVISGAISVKDLSDFLGHASGQSRIQPQQQEPTEKGKVDTLDNAEKTTIITAMEKYKGNVSKTATALGITRATLYRKLKRYAVNFR